MAYYDPQDSRAPGHVALRERLQAIQRVLVATHEGGAGMSSASKGTERESFIREYLEALLPNTFHIASGDIIDSDGRQSGQLDCILERPFMPGLPMPGGSAVRLALAEAVVGVVEVKSNLAGQWDEVKSTASRVQPLKRISGAHMVLGTKPSQNIPVFAVGYTGWKTDEGMSQNFAGSGVFGALVIDSGIYVSASQKTTGPWALWCLLSDLYAQTTGLVASSSNPLIYMAKALGTPLPQPVRKQRP